MRRAATHDRYWRPLFLIMHTYQPLTLLACRPCTAAGGTPYQGRTWIWQASAQEPAACEGGEEQQFACPPDRGTARELHTVCQTGCCEHGLACEHQGFEMLCCLPVQLIGAK